MKEELIRKGKLVIGISELPKRPAFITLSFTNSANTKKDIDYILDTIVHYGRKLSNPIESILDREPEGIFSTYILVFVRLYCEYV